MVEVPAAALDIASFPAAFFSIGSNDLTQYVTASSRDNGAVAALSDPRNPAVLRLVAEVARHGAAAGIEVSLCGDAGGDPAVIPALLAAGLRTLSVAPSALARTKVAIAAYRIGTGHG
jgi:phosphotransferase system enzyme I (PtsI)